MICQVNTIKNLTLLNFIPIFTFNKFSIKKRQMNTSIASRINNTISNFYPGIIFTYSDFNLSKENEIALAQSLSRLAKKGEIVRVEKGKYSKPRKTSFGNLRPDVSEIVKVLTRRAGKITGYATGISIYNQLGFTTQMSNTITIASTNPQPPREVSGYRIKFLRRDFDFEEKDIPLLQLLDVIKDIKKIPDSDPTEVLIEIIKKINETSSLKLKRLVQLALNYNSSTRALLGAILEQYRKDGSISTIYKTLNPLTKYSLSLSKQVLPNQSKWNIE